LALSAGGTHQQVTQLNSVVVAHVGDANEQGAVTAS
jgi:hypothetical protein